MPNSTNRTLYPNTKTLARSICKLQSAKVGLEALTKVEMAVGSAVTDNIREILVDKLHEAGSEVAELISAL